MFCLNPMGPISVENRLDIFGDGEGFDIISTDEATRVR